MMDINKLPIVGASLNEKPRLVVQYTLDGEVVCKKGPGGYVPTPLRTVELGAGYDLPEFVQPMSKFWALLESVREEYPERYVPLTKPDLMSFQVCSKKEYAAMIDKGLLKEVLVPIIDTETGKNLGSRRIIFFTPQGRAFVRRYIKPDYAKTENT
jgi:hypothetical protein